MTSKTIKYLIAFLLAFSALLSYGQTNGDCSKYLQNEFISLDKDLSVKVTSGDSVTFHVTFYKNYTYRIGACTDIDNSKILIELIDNNENTLYSNKHYGYSPYWDFNFNSTIDCRIRVTVIKELFNLGSLNLVIGYKKN